MIHVAVAALWGAWSVYQVLQGFSPYTRNERIGYFLGAGLSALTSYLLVMPHD